MKKLFDKIKEANLVGRGGSGFPTYKKWEFIHSAKGKSRFVVCNSSEGEPGVFKDIYILTHHLDKVFEGFKLTMDFIKTKYGYININSNYYKKVGKNINKYIAEYEKKGYKITIYKEHPSYIGGEETAILNSIEGKRIEPRLKPPHAAEKGLYGYPTLIHNVETLFNVACVNKGNFDNKRFYSISGEIKNPGVFHLKDNISIYQILKESGNLPNSDFFVQVGGGACGEIFNKKQIENQVTTGAGSIEVYKISKNPKEMLMKWLSFYKEESCGKCTPCREGTFQLFELVRNNEKILWKKIFEILNSMELTSFCYLGKSVAIPIKSYYQNVFKGKK